MAPSDKGRSSKACQFLELLDEVIPKLESSCAENQAAENDLYDRLQRNVIHDSSRVLAASREKSNATNMRLEEVKSDLSTATKDKDDVELQRRKAEAKLQKTEMKLEETKQDVQEFSRRLATDQQVIDTKRSNLKEIGYERLRLHLMRKKLERYELNTGLRFLSAPVSGCDANDTVDQTLAGYVLSQPSETNHTPRIRPFVINVGEHSDTYIQQQISNLLDRPL